MNIIGRFTTNGTSDPAHTAQKQHSGHLHTLKNSKIVWLAAFFFALLVCGVWASFAGGTTRLYVLRLCGVGLGAMGLAYFFTLSGQLCMGCGGFMAMGAYGAALVLRGGDTMPTHLLALVTAVLLPVAVALPVGLGVLRLKGDYLSLATLGLGEMIRIFLENFEPTGGAAGLFGLPHWSSPWATVVLAATVFFWLRKRLCGKTGLLGRAVAADDLAAAASGVSVFALKTRAFCVMAAVCGLAGFCLGGTVGFVHPTDFGYLRSCDTLAAVVLGGGSLAGAFLAGMALEGISMIFSSLGIYKLLVYGCLLLVFPMLQAGHPAAKQKAGERQGAQNHSGGGKAGQTVRCAGCGQSGKHPPVSGGDAGTDRFQRCGKNHVV